MIIALFIISLFGGFLSGFLGLGGAIVMIPLLLTVPPLFHVGTLTMKSVAGLSMIQVFFASISGLIIHQKNQFVNYQGLLFIGIPLGIFSFVGSYFSKYLSNENILILFGFVILVAFFLLLFDSSQEIKDETNTNTIAINKPLSIIIGIVVGSISGIVGAGGGIILIPTMIKILKLPLKITIGTSIGIVFIGALFGAIGKILSLQVNYFYLMPVVLGSLLSAQLGARLSKFTPPEILKNMLLIVIAICFIQIIVKIL